MTRHRTHSLPPAVHKTQLAFRIIHHLKVSNSDEYLRLTKLDNHLLEMVRTLWLSESKTGYANSIQVTLHWKTRAPRAYTLEVGVSLASSYHHSADKCVVHFSSFLNPQILCSRTFEKLKWNMKGLKMNSVRLHGPRTKAFIMKDASVNNATRWKYLHETLWSKRYTLRRFKHVVRTCSFSLAHAG